MVPATKKDHPVMGTAFIVNSSGSLRTQKYQNSVVVMRSFVFASDYGVIYFRGGYSSEEAASSGTPGDSDPAATPACSNESAWLAPSADSVTWLVPSSC